MAVKGALAKEYVAKKIAEVFGADYIGEVDKKLYVWAQENGEKIQIAIAMTCPKTPIGDVPTMDFSSDTGDFDFSGDATTATPPTAFQPAVITAEEKANIASLMEKLGL